MPFHTFSDEESLTATNVNKYWVQQAHVIKPSDETRASTTTFTDDSDLVLPLLANTQYLLEFMLIYDGIQAADIKIQWAYPSGTTIDWTHGGLGTSATSTVSQVSRNARSETSTGTIGCPNAATGTSNAVIPGEGRVIVAGTAGNLALQWAQNTSNATGTILRARSIMILQRLTS